MSKSRRKFPLLIQASGTGFKYHNRKLRYDKLVELPNGSAFKKHSPHWSSSWCYRWSREQAIEDWRNSTRLQNQFLTLEEWLNYWESCTIRK
jgi:hypothetical protein